MSEIKRWDNVRIFKYVIPIDDRVEIELPSVCNILSVQLQGVQVCMWCRVNTKAVLRKRVFYVVGTGHPFPEDANKYVGTVQDGSLVWHIFSQE